MDDKWTYMLAHQAQWAEEYKYNKERCRIEKYRAEKNRVRLRDGKPVWTHYRQVGRRAFGFVGDSSLSPANPTHCAGTFDS